MNKKDKFDVFLEGLRSKSNSDLIDIIMHAHSLIESLSTDDANAKPNGLTVSHPSPASAVNMIPNRDNEYFDQTLPDWLLNIVNQSYHGKKIGLYPQAGRTSNGKDALKSNETSNYNANGVGGEWAGGSGGYNLGGPSP
jgi:hypothetical protein